MSLAGPQSSQVTALTLSTCPSITPDSTNAYFSTSILDIETVSSAALTSDHSPSTHHLVLFHGVLESN
jgi:hypothetical protein